MRRWCALLPSLVLLIAGCGVAGDTGTNPRLSGPIEIIVPYAAGGGTDQSARKLASAAESTCEVPTIVSNQEGAAGAVGFQAITGAAPDGTTVGVVTTELSMLRHLGTAEVSPKALRGILQYNFDPAAFAVAGDSPYTSMDDVIEAAKSGEMVAVGTSGAGSIWEISAAGMAEELGIELTQVPYDGAAPAITALRGGVVDATSVSGAEILGQVESGDARPLAVMSDERLDILPDTPTLREEGIDWISGTWRGLAVPNDTPDGVARELERCFTEAARSPGFVDFMDRSGFGRQYRDAAAFDTYMDRQYSSFGTTIPQVTGGEDVAG